MANEKVVLRRGPSSSIPSTKVPGTILIETDTGRAYVDDTESNRIQIKDDTKLPVEGKAKDSEHADLSDAAKCLNSNYTIDGVAFNGSAAVRHFGYCTTSGSDESKKVAITNFTLTTGSRVTVKFTYSNTALQPKLNVNSTGDVPIYYKGSPIDPNYLRSNNVYEFIYTSDCYEIVGNINDDTVIDDGSID